MKFAYALVALAVLSAVSEARRHYYYRNLEENDNTLSVRDDVYRYFDQRNDHFRKNDVSTFKQRYIINDTYWGGNPYPIFVMLGGEGPMAATELTGRFIINEKTAVYKALMVSIEHRFYGNSTPGDGTLKTDNLHLLSADQALADYAVLIKYVKDLYNATNSKVVTFGGSYSGSLSAWMRQKYPNIVDIAYASSAPVQAQLDFPEYFKVVTDSVGDKCALRIAQAFKTIEKYMSKNKTKLLEDFKGCNKNMVTKDDEVTFLESLSDSVAGCVQYSGDNNMLGRAWNVSRMCDIITKGDDPYDAYVAFTRAFMGDDCLDSNYDDVINELKNADPRNPNAAGRSWTYQTCVEYGYYQTDESDDVPFSQRVNLQYFLGMCEKVFNITESGKCVDYTNDYYGGRNVNSDKIVFLNGSVDPWHALGLVNDTSKPNDMPVCYIQGTAHCADLYSTSPNDLSTLNEARTKAWKYVDDWINDLPVTSSSEHHKSSGASNIRPQMFGVFILLLISFFFCM